MSKTESRKGLDHVGLWWFLTYNRTKYLSQTLTKCLNKTSDLTMQIEVIDNCSTSADIEAEINNISSHNRVSFYRQPLHIQPVLTSQPVAACSWSLGSHYYDDDVVADFGRLQQAFENELTIAATHMWMSQPSAVLTDARKKYTWVVSNWLALCSWFSPCDCSQA